MVRFFRSARWFLFLPALVLLPFAGFAGGGNLYLQRAASYEKHLIVPSALRSDCRLDTKIVDFIGSFAGDDFDKITLVDTAAPGMPGKLLTVNIIDLSCSGGGAWSGPKYLTIEGTLSQDGKVIGTFTGHRITSGGALGAYKGTCSLLARCARTLGKDVAVWLKNPSMGAKLGDAK